jgi:hypothetical protein
MRYLFSLFALAVLFSTFYACKPEDERLNTDPKVQLRFSEDTVMFDTVFAQVNQAVIGSVTRRLWVYNEENRGVTINRAEVAHESGNQYAVIVNGETKPINNLLLRGNDSLLVLVRVNITPQDTTDYFLVSDHLRFYTNGSAAPQEVLLLARGKRAIFHTGELTIDCPNIEWNASVPHLLYGNVIVPASCTLTVQKGTTVYSHRDARLTVKGHLQVNGGIQKDRVLFRADRIEPPRFGGGYENVAGQWFGLVLDGADGDGTCQMQGADVINSVFGLLIANQQAANGVALERCLIKNVVQYGILALGGNFALKNCIVTNCGAAALAGLGGGEYSLQHCTVANYRPDFPSSKDASVQFSDAVEFGGTPINGPLTVGLSNSVIWGLQDDELLLSSTRAGNLLTFNQTLFRLKDQDLITAIQNQNTGNIISSNPDFPRFVDPNKPAYNFKPDSTSSPLLHKAGQNLSVTDDFYGNARPSPGQTISDIGAIEVIEP